MRKERFALLDSIRFFAASFVILSHLLEVFIVRKYGFDELIGVGNIECWIGMLSVICFFVLSGYVIAYSVDKAIHQQSFLFSTYFRNRFCRIYPVAWGAVLSAICVVAIMYFFNLKGLDSNGLMVKGDLWGESNYLSYDYLLYSLTLPPVGFFGGFFNVALWSLSYEFAFYIVYGAAIASSLYYGFARTITYSLFILIAAFTWYEMAILGGTEKSGGILLSLQLFLKQFPCWNFSAFLTIWSMGVYLYYFCKHHLTLNLTVVFLLPLIAIITAIILHQSLDVPFHFNPYPETSKYSDPNFSVFMLMDYTLMIVWAIYLILHIKKIPTIISITAVLGKKYSYSLYATHFIVINLAFGMVADKLNTFTNSHFALLFIAIYVAANIFAYYFAKIFEQRQLWIEILNGSWLINDKKETPIELTTLR